MKTWWKPQTLYGNQAHMLKKQVLAGGISSNWWHSIKAADVHSQGFLRVLHVCRTLTWEKICSITVLWSSCTSAACRIHGKKKEKRKKNSQSEITFRQWYKRKRDGVETSKYLIKVKRNVGAPSRLICIQLSHLATASSNQIHLIFYVQ